MGTHSYRPAEGHRLPHDPFNAIVGPRPIGWVSTVSATGVRNIAETREFTWNLVSRAQAQAMNATSATVGPEVDEFSLAGLEGLASVEVRPDRVAGAPVSFECRLTQLVRLTDQHGAELDTWLSLGEVVSVHINEDLLVDGVYDTAAAEPVLRGGRPTAYFAVTADQRFDMVRPA